MRLSIDSTQLGKIRGIVKFEGPAPSPAIVSPANTPAILDEKLIVNPNHTLRNAVISIKNPPDRGPPVSDNATLDQLNCQYVPHVLAVTTEQKVLVKNSDPTLHNIHCLSKLQPEQNIGTPRQGDTKELTFHAPEFIRVACDVHPWMRAYVAVFDHSYFAVTDADGAFELPSLPAGVYTLACWQERLGSQETKVTITPNTITQITFTYAIPEP